jgi:hypothetical protein
MAYTTAPSVSIDGYRSAFPGETGNTSFTSSPAVCATAQGCDSDNCDPPFASQCDNDAAGPSPYIVGYKFTPVAGTSCTVNYGY